HVFDHELAPVAQNPRVLPRNHVRIDLNRAFGQSADDRFILRQIMRRRFTGLQNYEAGHGLFLPITAESMVLPWSLTLTGAACRSGPPPYDSNERTIPST